MEVKCALVEHVTALHCME